MLSSCAIKDVTPSVPVPSPIILRYRSIDTKKPLKYQRLIRFRHLDYGQMKEQNETYQNKKPLSSKKLPALQFYPGDWWRDLNVKLLDHYLKGVWFEILLLMHDNEERGCLTINGRAMTDTEIGLLIGLVNQEDNQIATKAITKLLELGVASRREGDGALVCRRMLRDEEIRSKRIKAGSMGGNPILVNQKVKQEVNQRVNQITEDEYEVEDEDEDLKKENSKPKKIQSLKYPKLWFTEEERDKLKEHYKAHELEEDDLAHGLEVLQSYAENNSRKFAKYKNHYLVMRGWVFDQVLERRRRMLDLARSEAYAAKAGGVR